MIKARILLMVVPLITYATMSMICSDVPVGLVYERFILRY